MGHFLRSIAGLATVALCAGLAVRCSNSTAPTATVSSITIKGLLTYTAIGIKAQYQAIAAFTNNSTLDVTSQAVWTSSDASRLSMTAGGLATYLAGSGSVTVSAAYKGVTGAASVSLAVPGEDCGGYTPAALFAASFSGAFIVTDGQELFFQLDNLSDANKTVALMQGYTSLCFVGRNNSRSNRKAYIFVYWKPAGPPPQISPEDCVPYDNTHLTTSASADGVAILDGSTQVALLDTQADANILLGVARQYGARCYIGRGNTRPSPADYTVAYWK